MIFLEFVHHGTNFKIISHTFLALDSFINSVKSLSYQTKYNYNNFGFPNINSSAAHVEKQLLNDTKQTHKFLLFLLLFFNKEFIKYEYFLVAKNNSLYLLAYAIIPLTTGSVEVVWQKSFSRVCTSFETDEIFEFMKGLT